MSDGPLPQLRVAFVTHSSALSGAEMALTHLLPALTEVDSTVLVAENGPLVGALSDLGVGVQVVPLPSRTVRLRRADVTTRRLPLVSVWDSLVWTWRLRRHLAAIGPDIVDTESMKAHLCGGFAARSLGLIHVWRAHDRIDPEYVGAGAARVLRTALRWGPRHVVANSRSTAESTGLADRRVSVVPIGVPKQPTAPRRNDGPFVVGHVGRLAPWKGQDVFLRAFAEAFPAGQERARVVGAALFGEDDYAASLPLLAAELGVADRVEFTGFQRDTGRQLATMSVLVHSSVLPEPFGQVVVEGMSAGLPVLASDAGGPAEIITDDVTGGLVTPGDVHALAAALRRVAADPDLRDRWGAAAKGASLRYRPERVARELTAIYRALVEEGPLAADS